VPHSKDVLMNWIASLHGWIPALFEAAGESLANGLSSCLRNEGNLTLDLTPLGHKQDISLLV